MPRPHRHPKRPLAQCRPRKCPREQRKYPRPQRRFQEILAALHWHRLPGLSLQWVEAQAKVIRARAPMPAACHVREQSVPRQCLP